MKKQFLFLLLIVLLFGSNIYSQSDNNLASQKVFNISKLYEKNLKTDTVYLGKSYNIIVKTDGINYYYLLDLVQFNSTFEKLFCKDYMYQNNPYNLKLEEFDIKKPIAVYSTDKKYYNEEMVMFFATAIKMTKTANSNYSENQKNEFLKNN